MDVTGDSSSCITFDPPDHIIAKILSRIPFPEILKVRLLSKKWAIIFADRRRAVQISEKLSTDPGDFSESSFFQTEVSSVSSSWPKYFPILTTKQGFVGYERSSNHWKRFSLHPMIPPEEEYSPRVSRLTTFQGPLLCRVYSLFNGYDTFKVRMANLLTGSCSETPTPGRLDLSHGRSPSAVHVVRDGFSHYKILLLYDSVCHKRENRLSFRIQVYASYTGEWKLVNHITSISSSSLIMSSLNSVTMRLQHSVCFNDNLYGVFVARNPLALILYKFSIRTESWTVIIEHVPHEVDLHYRNAVISSSLGSHGHVILTLVFENFRYLYTGAMQGFHIMFCSIYMDVETLDVILTKKRSPPSDFGPGAGLILGYGKIFGDETFSFLSFYAQQIGEYTENMEFVSLWLYDIQKSTWTVIPVPSVPDLEHGHEQWVTSTFAPGLNPFAEVQ